MTGNIEIDEAWTTLQRSPEAVRALSRFVKSGRTPTAPASLESGENYRAWCLSRVELFARYDETDEERESTRQWRSRVESASAEELRSEYSEARHPMRIILSHD